MGNLLIAGGFISVMSFAILLCFAIAFSLHLVRRLDLGIIQYYPHVILISNGLAIFLSARNYVTTGEFISDAVSANPVIALVIKFSSAFAMLAAVDQIVRYCKVERKVSWDRALLGTTFILFWISNVLLPAYLSLHTVAVELSWFYSLVLGLGVILINPLKPEVLIKQFREALLVFCLIGLLLSFWKPELVLQTNYTQGYIPGLPRFAGLAPHAILMGVLASLALFCLYVSPFSTKWLNSASYFVAFVALVMSQSKNVWVAFVLLTPFLYVYKDGESSIGQKKSTLRFNPYILLAFLWIIPISIILAFAGLGMGDMVLKVFDEKQANQLFSLTGRDQIWRVAIEEWRQAPWFGYGLPLFGDEHRNQINMYYATSGHNQIYDNLARVGLVGLFSGLLHFAALIYLGFKFRGKTRGLSLVLALSIAIRMVSEVPITLLTIGLDTFPYYLLMALLGKQMVYEKSKVLRE